MLICRYLVVGVACGLVGVVPQATDNPFIGVVDNSRHVITETFRSEIKHAGLSFYDEVRSFSRQITLGKVYHMEIDHKRPGYVIYTDKGSLRSTNGVNVVEIAGTRDQSGYANGAAKDSRFEDYIPYFMYYNETNLLIADSINACLRLLNLELNTVSDYAGRCKTRGHENGKILQAKFKRPVNMLYGEGSWKNYLYILDNEADAVRFINLKFDYVNTLYRDDKINRPTGLIIHPDSTDKLIVQSSVYIKAIFTHPYKNQKSDPEIIQEVTNNIIKRNNWGIDGPFNEAYLPGNDKLVPVAKDIFVTASKDEGRVRVIDFKKKGVSSICTILRPARNGEQFRAGTISTCELPHVEGVSVLNSTIYIGTGQGIFGLPVRYTCTTSPPNIANTYVKDSSWKADYTCVDGFRKIGGDSTLYCTALKGWGGEHIRCEQIIYKCSGPPPSVANGIWGGNSTGAMLKCNDGFKILSGDEILFCPKDTWIGEMPICGEVIYKCEGPPRNVANGTWGGNATLATIKCNVGFVVVSGDETIHCPHDAWIGEFPTCGKFNDVTVVQALSANETCPYSLDFLKLDLTCQQYLIIIAVTIGVLLFLFFCCCVGCLRRNRREAARPGAISRTPSHSFGASPNNLHVARASRSVISPDRKSIGSRRSSTSRTNV